MASHEHEKSFYEGIFRPGWLGREIAIRCVLFASVGLCHLLIPPFRRRIQPEKWHKYRFPYTHREAFPAVWTAVLLGLSPLMNLAIMMWLIRRRKSSRQLYRQSVYYALGLLLSVGIAMLICEIVKRFYGALRPDFLSRCFGANDSATLILIARKIKV
eukprot:Gregarina_sp_Poly_1__3979@NODE_21_length_20913_cov_102_783268_g19_i0_p15_GENE_NODE_21_length_20913_cov_102_783268_g19_i0NODE_21_length_20913_cov_102_783268_g19_i0_p15_ORF_typecomplete_len158_score6_81PAP2/PF01569_21/8_6e02PAP2/PF01569_21/0_00036DUF2569/PF10754_9/0_0036HisKA_7TM/PF16927_5/0_011L_HMGIC_fpl/PF10242_9/0_13DUF1461/PF07314_11/5_5e03DUF1461/PF07314_11/0_47EptA_B_N/PF08019_12/3_6e03EptA_B_N/PF08019_12/0_23_NODE_21_length_20913_cov_102_783268_g19_i01511915592